MFYIDNASASNTLQTPAAAGSHKFFQDATTPGTIVTADWLNMVQEELNNVVVAAGLTPSKTTYNQLLLAIQALGQTAGYPGDLKLTALAVAQPGWAFPRGQAISRSGNPVLFASMGTYFGPGDGVTTFNLFNADGYALRVLDSVGSIDPGRVLGTIQQDMIKAHNHNSGMPVSTGSGPLGIYGQTSTDVPGSASQRIHTDALSGGEVQAVTGSAGTLITNPETRMKNIAFPLLIKLG